MKKFFLHQYKEYISSEISCLPEELCSIVYSYLPKKISIPQELLYIENNTFHYKDNIIYIIGGIKDSQVLNTIYIWDIYHNKVKKSTLLHTLWLHKSIMIDNYIYIFGGETFQKKVIPTIQRFNINTEKCTFYSNMIYPRCSFSIEKYKDFIYCIGGDSGYREYGVLSSMEKVHLSTKTSILCKSLELETFFHSSCIQNNCIYVFGGLDGNSEHFIPDIRIYDIKKNIWSKNPIHTFSSIEHISILYKDTILLYNGYNNIMNKEYNIYQFSKDILTLYQKNEYPILSIIEIDNIYYKITNKDNYVVFSLFT